MSNFKVGDEVIPVNSSLGYMSHVGKLTNIEKIDGTKYKYKTKNKGWFTEKELRKPTKLDKAMK